MASDNVPAEMLKFIMDNTAAGRTVYVSTMTRSTAVTAKTLAKWEKAGLSLFKISTKGNLLMAEGRRYVTIAMPHYALVGLSAR